MKEIIGFLFDATIAAWLLFLFVLAITVTVFMVASMVGFAFR